MKKEEREIFNLINKVKIHMQDHVVMKPMALSNYHHFADRLLDKKDGNFKSFKQNVREMIKYTNPVDMRGEEMLGWLEVFVYSGEEIEDFIDVANTILDI